VSALVRLIHPVTDQEQFGAVLGRERDAAKKEGRSVAAECFRRRSCFVEYERIDRYVVMIICRVTRLVGSLQPLPVTIRLH
jgi:hypothetical protein